jgi:hypothetical protein
MRRVLIGRCSALSVTAALLVARNAEVFGG